jgi:predicted transcriptional regulator
MSPEVKSVDPILAMSATVLAAYVGNHTVSTDELPGLAQAIYRSLINASGDDSLKTGKAPAVPVDESITDSHLICLEDGKRFQSLKRHLRVAFGLTPEDYREKWGLPDDYPMVSPAYARRRSELAKQSGLGKSA